MNYKVIIFHIILWVVYTIAQGQDPIGLRASAFSRQLPFGAAVDVNLLRNNVDQGQYVSYLKKNYMLVVPEGEMKPVHIWQGENNYNWTDPDWLLGESPNSTGWVQQNNMLIRGHNLVWANDKRVPQWLLQQESSISPSKAYSLLSDYIHAVVRRYQGKVWVWDVINEAIDDRPNNTHPFNLRDCFWFRKLGANFIKYAFIFAHEADPQTQLYYNEYGIETLGVKVTYTLELLQWLRSQGVTVHGLGMQWHIEVSVIPQPGDLYYQSAQKFVDNNFTFMVTELDVSIAMNGSQPKDPTDIQKQSLVYRAVLQYVLHFSPNCRAQLTWGFTDRYSWIPTFTNHTRGDALPTDSNYQPKPAYWAMQEELSRVLPNGTYRLWLKSQPNKCLEMYDTGMVGQIRIDVENDHNPNQQWSFTWLTDGTYRLSPMSFQNRALYTNNATGTHGGVQATDWLDEHDQQWVLAPLGNNMYRVGPRSAWWRALNVYNMTNVVIDDYTATDDQHWIITSI